jgi:hypothetical protein
MCPFVSRANHPPRPALVGRLEGTRHGVRFTKICQEVAMRKIIGAMKISIDGKTERFF